MKPRIAFVIGHSKKAPGARSKDGLSEYVYNSGITDNIWSYSEKFTDVDICVFYRDEKSISQSSHAVNSYLGRVDRGLMVELHCNSAEDDKARGTEVLYCESSKISKPIAVLFQRSLHGLFQVKDRGLKPVGPGERGYWSLSSIAEKPAILLEPLFISNDSDLALLRLKQAEYAQLIFDVAYGVVTNG